MLIVASESISKSLQLKMFFEKGPGHTPYSPGCVSADTTALSNISRENIDVLMYMLYMNKTIDLYITTFPVFWTSDTDRIKKLSNLSLSSCEMAFVESDTGRVSFRCLGNEVRRCKEIKISMAESFHF